MPISSAFSITRATSTSRGPRASDPATREVPDAVHVRVLHRLEHPLGRADVGRVVHRRDDPVEQREILVRDVDLAVRADVRLDPREDAQLREPRAQLLDLLELRLQAAPRAGSASGR